MSFHHLIPYECGRIDALHRSGNIIGSIAQYVGRHQFTISRELRRLKTEYHAQTTQAHYVRNRKRVGRPTRILNEWIHQITITCRWDGLRSRF